MIRSRKIAAAIAFAFLLISIPLYYLEAQGEGKTEQDSYFSAGVAVIISPRPYAGTDGKVFAVPALSARYKRLFFNGIRGGFDFFKSDNWTGSALVQAQFKGLEPEDSPFLEGMKTRRKSADGMLVLRYQGRPVGFRTAFQKDLLGRSSGEEVSVQAVTGVPLGKALLLAGIGPRWLSADRVDYYYGVRPSEAAPGRPAYKGRSSWNWDVSLSAFVGRKSRWSFLTIFNREGYGLPVKDSPLIDQNGGYTLVSSLAYRF
ncbi:MipA/OmpV family protein [Acidobacteriota bacterium]